MSTVHPVWTGDVELLFAEPYWIPSDERANVAASWAGCMSGYDVVLQKYESVRSWGALIFHMLHSRMMPLTDDERQYWPDDALERYRTWVNEGYRRCDADPVVHDDVIPYPVIRPERLRVRKDLRSLTQRELDEYRMRLDDILRIGDPNPRAPGQKLAHIHGDWCLHYQEAFLFWHRAYLMYVESLIGCAIPYWNWFAQDASIDGSPNAGLPQAFKDEHYVHPKSGEKRLNPLRFAAALDGKSKACRSADGALGVDCRYVQRDPLLYTEGDERRAEREKKIAMVRIFQDQVVNALSWNVFSVPQGSPGYPWANLPTFTPPQPDDLYPNRTDFDGLYEQPHDNWHGWVGPDMADNNFTAFDPAFWSYHANIDRMFEIWLRSHRGAMFSAMFPLRPFVGKHADHIEFDDPHRWFYTNIGDIARDSRALGYDFAPPVTPDYRADAIGSRFSHKMKPDLSYVVKPDRGLYVVFSGVRCTHESYTIDAFVNQPDAGPDDVAAHNAHYAGRFTRIGMGVEDDKGRCITHGVTRLLDATPNAAELALSPDVPVTLTLLVRRLATGVVLTPDEYRELPGFDGRLVWGEHWAQAAATGTPVVAADAMPETQDGGGPCCGADENA